MKRHVTGDYQGYKKCNLDENQSGIPRSINQGLKPIYMPTRKQLPYLVPALY